MKYSSDNRIVMTLDAGGTNFVFTAIQANEEIIDEITLPSNANDLEKCLTIIVKGFQTVKDKLKINPTAISFAFPGPADYPNGIIGDLQNLPAFRGGVALGPYLQEQFRLPVFINNDGNLFTYGEAIAGLLPVVNHLLEKAGNPKRYKNLLGITIGTGIGAGIVSDGKLLIGDNSLAAEIWLLRSKINRDLNIEEYISIRALQRVYSREAGIRFDDSPSPKDIYEICIGKKEGNIKAAMQAFKEMGEALGDAISNAMTLIDGLVVIGGGLSGASSVLLPHVVNEMKSNFLKSDGRTRRRLLQEVYNLEYEIDLNKFLQPSAKEILIPGTDIKVKYNPEARTGIDISKLGTSKAVAIGAYAFALASLDQNYPDC